MKDLATIFDSHAPGEAAREEAVGLAVGLGFTFTLFFALAHFENVGASEPSTMIEDLPAASTLIEPPPPPPKIVEQAAMPEAALPFAGLDVGASDSPVTIAVVPPDLESLIPSTTNPPRASIQVGYMHTELKPKMEIEVDARHVYQESEVDQLPRALVRATPYIPQEVRDNAKTLRSVLLLVIDQKGRVESARVAKTSGNPEFDAIIARTVREEWVFTPAIRRSRKVKCLAQQAFRVNFVSASPFEAR